MPLSPDPLSVRQADHPIQPLFLQRWSSRAMNGQPVSASDLARLFEAARWAPSTYNEQEWRFLYAHRDGPHWPTFFDLLMEANQVWCRQAGVLVVASGGGGIPVAEMPDGTYEGREAVIDKDLAAVVLARAVGAEALLLLTDVDAVYRDWGTDHAEAIRRLSPEEAYAGLEAMAWPAGSMGPKIRACADFVRTGGRFAAIGRLEDAAALAWGRAGTRFGSGRLGLPRFISPDEAAPSG